LAETVLVELASCVSYSGTYDGLGDPDVRYSSAAYLSVNERTV